MKKDLFAEITGISGAILLALNIGLNNIAYILFAISTVFWILHALEKSDRISLLRMNIVFLIINIVGFYNYSG